MNSNQRISKRIFQCNSDYSITIDRAPATKKRWQSLIASVCAFLLTVSSAGPIVEAGESADQSQPITTPHRTP